MITSAVLGIGVYGPGLVDWPAARAVLSGAAAYARTDDAAPPSGLLPAAERRRATPSTRTALTAAQQALQQAAVDPTRVPAVFGSDSGSPEIIHDICAMLAAGDYQISPTKFHNSVHNAVSGYYSIAVASHCSITSLCALDGTAAAVLLETAVQATADQTPVLMVCYDLPYPFPLSEARASVDGWAVALVLAPSDHASAIARLTLSDADDDAADTALDDPALNAARLGNPTARLLPLLAALAQPQPSASDERRAAPSSARAPVGGGSAATGGEHIVVLRQGSGRGLRVQAALC